MILFKRNLSKTLHFIDFILIIIVKKKKKIEKKYFIVSTIITYSNNLKQI